jgi:hypothetical protein
MAACQNEGDQEQLATVQSCLGDALIRIHQTIERTRHHEAHVENLFHSWQSKWGRRREQIMTRLEHIESQLNQLTQTPEPTPSLSVVHDTTEREHILGMGQI